MAKDTTEQDRMIGQAIRLARDAMGFTQQQLAERMGVSFQQLQKYETGTNRVPASRLIDIAEALRVTPNDLLLIRPAAQAQVWTRQMREAVSIVNGINDANRRRRWLDIGKAMMEEK